MVGKKQDISGKIKNALYATGHFCHKIVLVCSLKIQYVLITNYTPHSDTLHLCGGILRL